MVLRLDIGKRTERLTRLLAIDDAGTEAVLIDIDNPKARVYSAECKDLEGALIAGKAAAVYTQGSSLEKSAIKTLLR